MKNIIKGKWYSKSGVDEREYSSEVWARKEKLEKYALLRSDGCSEEVALKVVDVRRATLFRWKRQLQQEGLSGLENASRCPNKRREPTWTRKTEAKVCHLRKKYAQWGKAKLAVIYKREYGISISVSTVGRILKKLVSQGRIRPVSDMCMRKIAQPRKFNGHAERLKRGMKALQVGDLIQMDHMSIEVPGQGRLKHFNATCPISRLTAEKVYKRAGSLEAADFLNHAIAQFPFKIRSIQVDGGSEFMKHFELACKKNNIPLYVIPPRSPECNGNVERSNGTFKYEFYTQFQGGKAFHQVQRALQKFTTFYNKVRPHQGINYLTPFQFFHSISSEERPVSYVLD